jgi:hypothetical protein
VRSVGKKEKKSYTSMFLFYSIAEHLHFLIEDCFPGIESGIMVIEDLIISDNTDTPSSKDNYIH